MDRDIWLEHMESRCGCDDDGFEPEVEPEAEPDAAQAVADDAARRVARNTTGDTKRTALAMGVDLLGDFRFMEGHRCTSDCRREGCEVVQGWQRRAEAE
jgi:hypothetical protein